MARFNSTITDHGAETLTRIVALGLQLRVTRAACGDGVASESPNTLTDLVSQLSVDTQVGEKEYILASPSYMRIPIQVTNEDLTEAVWIREVGTYALDENGAEFLFSYSWLDGADSDNVLPPSSNTGGAGSADTVHIHDVAIVVTDQENSTIVVEIGAGSAVTFSQMVAYAAPLIHLQSAETIIESTGQNTEEVQRRQDFDIQAVKEQLDTGFTGTTVTHTFIPAEMNQWKGYNGAGLPEGVLDLTQNRLYL